MATGVGQRLWADSPPVRLSWAGRSKRQGQRANGAEWCVAPPEAGGPSAAR